MWIYLGLSEKSFGTEKMLISSNSFISSNNSNRVNSTVPRINIDSLLSIYISQVTVLTFGQRVKEEAILRKICLILDFQLTKKQTLLYFTL